MLQRCLKYPDAAKRSDDRVLRRLQPVHGRVRPVGPHELRVPPVLDDPAGVEHVDAIRPRHRRQPVGHEDHRPAGGRQPGDLLGYTDAD